MIFCVNLITWLISSSDRKVKHLQFYVLVFFPVLFTACGECGRHVNLGDYYLESESILDYFPYSEIKTLTFKNSEGITLTCQLAERKEDMIYNVHRETRTIH